MKRFKYLLIITCLITGSMSCKKFLDTKPTDSWSPENSYNSKDKLTAAMAGIYDKIGSENLYGNFLFLEFDAGTDDSYYARNPMAAGTELASYNFTFSNPRIAGFWADCYTGIQRANLLIANIDQATSLSASDRAAFVAEAKFLRGYYYFMLVTRFGDVPLRLDVVEGPIGLDIARTPARDVYNQIIKDMTEAEADLPSASKVGTGSKVSKTVAEGILARVCLHMAGQPVNDNSKYAEALSWATKVKQSGEHALRTTFTSNLTNSAYSQIFINHSQDIYDVKECMWEADFKGNRTDGYQETSRVGNTIGLGMTVTKFQNDSGYCYGFINATGRLYKLYDTLNDQRFNWNIQPYTFDANTGARKPIITTAANKYGRNASKWRRTYELLTPKNQNHTPTNFPILRYADVLLMLAEAENQVNGPTSIAYEALNMVRRRAYGVNISTPSAIADAPAFMSKSQFQLYIEDERSRELCFEALRRQDLIRWGKFITSMKTVSADIAANGGGTAYGALAGNNVSERHLLYPIPANEISLNKLMTQNPGW